MMSLKTFNKKNEILNNFLGSIFFFIKIVRMHNTTIENLTNDVIFSIIKYLEICNIGNVFQVNKRFNSLKNNEKFWHLKLQQDYPSCCVNVKNLLYKFIYMTMKTKSAIYDWDKIIFVEGRPIEDSHIIENSKIGNNIARCCDEVADDKFIDEFNNTMSTIDPKSFVRDFYREKFLLNDILNTKFDSDWESHSDDDNDDNSNDVILAKMKLIKSIVDHETVEIRFKPKPRFGPEFYRIRIKCFYNDKYRFEFFTNYDDHEFICLYEIFDINKYWIVRCEQSHPDFTSHNFGYCCSDGSGPEFDNIFNNDNHDCKIDISDVQNPDILFKFFIVMSNIYIHNLNYHDDDEDKNEGLILMVKEFNEYRKYYKF